MPALIRCPRPGCDHPGPLGFFDCGPWATRFYHGSAQDCPGMWLFDGVWYASEADAWAAYKAARGPFDPDWIAAFDARIVEKNERKYKRHIKVWRARQDAIIERGPK